MKRSWIKLYVEVLDDPKMSELEPWVCWRFVQLCLVAAEGDEHGLLPSEKQLAWRLRIAPNDLVKALRAMSGIGVVCRTGDRWMVTNWDKRQYSESYERVRQLRERKRESNARSNGESNAAVTDNESTSISSSAFEEGGIGGEPPPAVQAAIVSARKTVDGILHYAAQEKYANRNTIPEPFLDYADVYNEVTGQTPRPSTRGDWISEFGVWRSAGVQAQDVRDANERLQKMDGFVATSPHAFTKMASAIHAKRDAAGAKPKTTLDRIRAELGGGNG